MSKIYNLERLQSYCKENGVTLLEENFNYDLNSNSIIKSYCLNKNCGLLVSKKFLSFLKTGSYCKKCNLFKSKKLNDSEYTTKYGLDSLEKYCHENNITLLKDYSKIILSQKSRIIGKCQTNNCENEFNKSFENFYKRSGYCNLCTKNIKVYKQKQTFLKNYGVDNPNKTTDTRNKIYETNTNTYGCKHAFNSKIIKDKIKHTMMQKYGVENPIQNKYIKEKIENTCLLKYGSKSPFNNCDVKEKIKKTNLQKYGFEYPTQNENIKLKVQETNLLNWGVKNPTQNAEIAEKAANNSYQIKIYTFPSGNIITYQGYENFALDELINIYKLDENDIINKKTDVPEIWYCDESGKKHKHYVDIFIPSQNRCIEVKSEWTYNIQINSVLLKQSAAKELGYNYEIWIYDKKGNKTCYD
jgi:hypothetical protein